MSSEAKVGQPSGSIQSLLRVSEASASLNTKSSSSLTMGGPVRNYSSNEQPKGNQAHQFSWLLSAIQSECPFGRMVQPVCIACRLIMPGSSRARSPRVRHPFYLKTTRTGSFVLYAYAADIAAAPSLYQSRPFKVLWHDLIGGRLAASYGYDFRGSTAEDTSARRGNCGGGPSFFVLFLFYLRLTCVQKPAAPKLGSHFSFVGV